MPGYEVGLWYGFVGPGQLPADIVRRLNSEIVAALAVPDICQRLSRQGVDVETGTPGAFARLLVSDLARWAKVVKQAGIRAQ